MADERYEINHNGEIVIADSSLCADQTTMLQNLFSQFGWTCFEESKEGACHKLRLMHPSGESKSINVYSGTIRNEKRSPYEKKIQLGTASDPRKKSKDNTIILGIYVFNANDSFKDAIFVGYPIDERVNYDTNPSIRGTFVNKLLLQAKIKGFVYDEEHNSVGFRSEFIYYYLDNHYNIHYNKDILTKMEDSVEQDVEEEPKDDELIGTNVLLYGVPGAGKSHEIDKRIVQERSERVVFHPDYTYSDFVGQILPRVMKDNPNEEGKLRYVFEPGPFTKMLKRAENDSNNMYYLVIEEINRGNAPAIFGDIFQLLDRDKTGTSKYYITNYDIASEVYGDELHSVRIPNNLTIYASMNTSDQNVFTLDTAFQRRWQMTYIRNDVAGAEHANEKIQGSSVSWGDFASVINEEILDFNTELASSEDKQLGAYFVTKEELVTDKFPEKALKYLWDDAFKLERDKIFKPDIKSIGSLVWEYESEAKKNRDPIKGVMRAEVYKKMMDMSVNSSDEATDESEVFESLATLGDDEEK